MPYLASFNPQRPLFDVWLGHIEPCHALPPFFLRVRQAHSPWLLISLNWNCPVSRYLSRRPFSSTASNPERTRYPPGFTRRRRGHCILFKTLKSMFATTTSNVLRTSP